MEYFNSDQIIIRQLCNLDILPLELLLQADPSEQIVMEYVQSGTTYIATRNDQTVGVIVLLKTKPRAAEIMNVSVKEEYQNKGIAKRLIAHALDFAKANDITTVEIGTGNPGMQQMMLYQKCGFRIIGVDLDFFRRNYPEPIFENGLECRDMIRMRIEW